mgnify:CR=1 FL=1
MAVSKIEQGLVDGNSPKLRFQAYNTYATFHVEFASNKFTNLVFYEDGKVVIERYNNGWKPSATLRNADS